MPVMRWRLVSGIMYAVGAMRVRQAQEITVFEQVFAFFLFGGIFAFAMTFLPICRLWDTADGHLSS